jgi:predicted metal-dependent hydrolase
MSFDQTRDLLDYTRGLHRDLGRFYEGLLDGAPHQPTRELIASLVEHERTLEKRLAEYETEVSGNILDTFFKYMVDEHLNRLADYPVPEIVTAEYVIEAARHFDERLRIFYKDMARKALSEHVREVLLNLMELELREQMMLSKQALELMNA